MKYIDWGKILEISSLEVIRISLAFSAEKLGMTMDEPKKYATKSQLDSTFRALIESGELDGSDLELRLANEGGVELDVLLALNVPHLQFTADSGYASHSIAKEIYYDLKEESEKPYHGKIVKVSNVNLGCPLKEEEATIEFFVATVYDHNPEDLYVLLVPADVIDWDKLNPTPSCAYSLTSSPIMLQQIVKGVSLCL